MAAAAAAAASCTSSLPSRTVSRSSSNPTSFLTCISFLRFPPGSSFLVSPLTLSPASGYKALFRSINQKKSSRIFALVEEELITAAKPSEASGSSEEWKVQVNPCELYVCNIPRSCEIDDLSELFKPYGTVQSIEVSRNAETGISRGCAHVTMSSVSEAKAAIVALDGSDLGGREMRVRFSYDLFARVKNTDVLDSFTKHFMFESPYKAYVGNLAWSVRPQLLREHFGQFGSVVSARVLFDRKSGPTRVFGFVSFSSPEELQAALSLDGTEFLGRKLLVREVIKKE